MHAARYKRALFYAAYLLTFSLLVSCLAELVARRLWDRKYTQWLETSLHAFSTIDRELLLERYTPGYTQTVGQLLSMLETSGKRLSLEQTRQDLANYRIAPDDVAFHINQFGLKGPDISRTPPAGMIRVMTIGDSCTFGPYVDALSYARQLEARLNDRHPRTFEVVNAGHLGYNLPKVWSLLDEWLTLKPHIITIYIGWNRTILRADPRKHDSLYERFALYRLYYHALVNRADTSGVEKLFTAHYDIDDPQMNRLKATTFDVDLAWLKRIVDKIRYDLPETKVAVVTLAGLYTTYSRPTEADVSKGYATAFTKNLAAWAVLSERFNEELRAFASAEGIGLIELEHFARAKFVPRGQFFVDSVHPSAVGHARIAELFATSIEQMLSSTPSLHAQQKG